MQATYMEGREGRTDIETRDEGGLKGCTGQEGCLLPRRETTEGVPFRRKESRKW